MSVRIGLVLTICFFSASVNGQQEDAVIRSFRPVESKDGELGSTMTLQELKQDKGTPRRFQESKPFDVQPANEPNPPLSIRFYPANWELKPGQALLHFTRAQMLFFEYPAEKRILWQSNEWQRGEGEKAIPTIDEVGAVVTSLQPIFDELHELAMSEDFQWDHRMRDLRGPDVYMYLLPDVQRVRTMARLLILRIRVQLSQNDFEGALSSISDGLRLAEFVGQGETLIQKLVGIAISSMMRDQISRAIAKPGCPNLYWALATLPRPVIDIGDSVMWELNNITKVLPALADAESESWSDAEASRQWSGALEDLGMLSGNGVIGDSDFRIALAIASVTFVDSARERLIANGFSKERLNEIPGLQIVLIDAARELRRVGDQLGKAYLLPTELARPILKRQDEEFQAWLAKNRNTSVAAAMGGVLYPAVLQAKEAETRTAMTYNRLMTLEALRMHAATHKGQLPASLDLLQPVPAMPDSFTGEQFEYQVEQIEGKQLVTLKAEGPTNYKPMQTLRVTFPKPAGGAGR